MASLASSGTEWEPLTRTSSSSSSVAAPSSASVDLHRNQTPVSITHPNSSNVHTLRSQTIYTNDVVHTPWPQGLLHIFNRAYKQFVEHNHVPEDLLKELDKYTLSAQDFKNLIAQKETEKMNHIYLEEGKIHFDEYTLNPHGNVIAEFFRQVHMQDAGYRILDGSSGDGTISGIH